MKLISIILLLFSIQTWAIDNIKTEYYESGELYFNCLVNIRINVMEKVYIIIRMEI